MSSISAKFIKKKTIQKKGHNSYMLDLLQIFRVGRSTGAVHFCKIMSPVAALKMKIYSISNQYGVVI